MAAKQQGGTLSDLNNRQLKQLQKIGIEWMSTTTFIATFDDADTKEEEEEKDMSSASADGVGRMNYPKMSFKCPWLPFVRQLFCNVQECNMLMKWRDPRIQWNVPVWKEKKKAFFCVQMQMLKIIQKCKPHSVEKEKEKKDIQKKYDEMMIIKNSDAEKSILIKNSSPSL